MTKDEMASQVRTPEFQEALQQFFYKLKGDNGKCIAEGCNGRIVRSVRGASSVSGFIYSQPHCEVCKRQYTFAGGDIPVVGREQFQKTLSMRFTI